MSDQGFDFSPPPPRRERKEFEPPPWEKDQFGEIVKKRAEADPLKPRQDEPTRQVPELVAQPSGVSNVEPGTAAQPQQRKPASSPDDARIASMLFELRAEDPPATREFHKAGLVAGFFLVAVGVLLVIWGIVMISIALRRAGQGNTGAMIGLTVLMLGFGFAGTGAWFIFRSLRHQGVL